MDTVDCDYHVGRRDKSSSFLVSLRLLLYLETPVTTMKQPCFKLKQLALLLPATFSYDTDMCENALPSTGK